MTPFRLLMMRAGVSVPYLSARSGWSVGAIRRWQGGTAKPPAGMVEWLRRRIGDDPPRLGAER